MPYRTWRPRGHLLVGLAAAPVLAVLAACSGSTGGGATSATTSGATTSGATTATNANARVATVTVTAAHGCTPDRTSFPAGGLTVKVTNVDATAVSEVEVLSGERIVGEKENIPPGFTGEFAATVSAGSYSLYCPGATPERRTISVTGTSSTDTDSPVTALLAAGTVGYAKYVDTQIAALATAAANLNTALQGKNLASAQTAYMLARPFYEKIEPVAESFLIGTDSIDADIDARLDTGVSPASWRGFHRIEKGLFQDRSLTGLAGYGDKLVVDIGRLQKLTSGLKYKATELASGAVELLDEVASHKITGEEERYSHIDLLDFANNDEGSEQAFAQLQPALAKIDPALTATIASRFTALDKLVDTYRTTSNPSGYRLYSELTSADKRALAAAVKAVQEPLSQVAAKVAAYA